MALQRSGLPLLIIAAILLLASAGVVLLVANPFGDRDQSTAEQRPAPEPRDDSPAEPVSDSDTGTEATDDSATTEPEPAPEPEPVAEPAPEPTPEPSAQSGPETLIPASTRTVRTGDSLYSIAGEVWEDPFLWPILLVANDDAITDPDYLRPGARLTIPEWPRVDVVLSPARRRELSAAHVVAYEHYRSLGADAVGMGQGQPQWWLDRLGRTRENNARWVLYSGLRYDENLLDEFSGRVRESDLREVRGYVTRYGLPPNRR
jgi:hypothetical protein